MWIIIASVVGNHVLHAVLIILWAFCSSYGKYEAVNKFRAHNSNNSLYLYIWS